MNTVKILLSFFLACQMLAIRAEVFYVSPDGNDNNAGSFEKPFAGLMKAQARVNPGDTVFIRGGIYRMNESQIAAKQRIWTVVHRLYKSGLPGKMIHYIAFRDEKPVFKMSDIKPVNQRIMVFQVLGSWIHLKGFEVTDTQVTMTGHTQSECFHNEGSHNVYEQLAMHDGQAIGFYLTNGSDNLILNCDAYNNYDFTSEDGRGGNVDGFGCHPQPGSKNNIFRGCRAWFNSDDGYDCIRAAETVVFDNCRAFYNGYDTGFNRLADGNGFKAGGWGLKKDDRVPDSIARHIIMNCIAVGNKANGFYANHHPGGNEWYGNIAWKNAVNFNMLNRNRDFTDDVPGYGHVLKNNLSFGGRQAEIQNIDAEKSVQEGNSFSSGYQLSPNDFISTDEKLLILPRNADGSLPEQGFLKLKKAGNN